MGKLKKKKIKRTPLQLQKIREKQNKKMLENQLKKEMLIKNNIEEHNNKMMDIMNQLTEDDKKDMWFHLTTPLRYEKIKEEGLKGGVDGKLEEDKGFLYMVDTDCKKVWNGISVYHIGQKEDMKDSNGKKLNMVDGVRGMMDRDKKPYIVLGIPKKVFEILGCPLSEDMTEDLTNYNQNHRKVQLGNTVIPSSVFKVVYEGVSDMWKYETKDRWEFSQKFYKRKFGKWVPKFRLEVGDLLLGVIKYSERKKKNTNNFLKQTDEQIQTFLRMKSLKMMMNNNDNLKPSSQQNSTLVLNERTNY